jgi:hypothetical protein
MEKAQKRLSNFIDIINWLDNLLGPINHTVTNTV